MCSYGNNSYLYSLTGDKEQDEALLEPQNYMMRTLDDSVVLKLSRAYDYWLNIPKDKLRLVDEITTVLLAHYLIYDDISDNGMMRKGSPVTHKVYGMGNTINAGSYAASVAWERCFNLHPDAPQIFLEQFLMTNRGQGIEIYWREKYTCPTEEQYLEMARKKTYIFLMVMKLMQLFSDDKRDYSKLVHKLAVYLQIFDDYLSSFSKEYMDEKGFGDDITEGKFSFPIMHFINKYPNDNRVMTILKKRTTDVELKQYLISLLEDHGSHEYTLRKLAALRAEIKEELKCLGGNPCIEQILNPDRKKM